MNGVVLQQMSRIFLSHSSADERAACWSCAVAVVQTGWNDAVPRSSTRSEAWSRASDGSRRCGGRRIAARRSCSPCRDHGRNPNGVSREFLLAKSLNKLIFGVVLDDVPVSELPVEMTSEWQLCYLTGQGPLETIPFTHRGQPAEVSFLAEGLQPAARRAASHRAERELLLLASASRPVTVAVSWARAARFR